MGNRTLITYFISILGATLLFFGIASAGSYAADHFVFGKRFGNHTYAGPFNLSKQSQQDAEVKLTSDLLSMQNNMQTDLEYQDTTFALPSELVEYNPSATIEQANSESENSLVTNVSEDGLRTLFEQQLPMLTVSESELTAIADGISEKLKSGIMPQSVTLTDYLESHQPTTDIATASIQVDGLTSPVMELLENLNGTVIEPDTPFSLLQFIEETQSELLDENELTLLASALYEATLKTNFWIEDRTIGQQLTSGVKPGFESAINLQLGIDYSMTNPNDTSYILSSDWSNGALSVGITGLPLRYEYEPYVAETNKFEPKTVVQYTEDLSTGQVNIAEPGRDGFEVIVERRILEDGAGLTTENVSDDFYPPVQRVEQRPLIEAEIPEDNTGDSNSDSPNGNSEDNSDSNEDGSSSDSGSNSSDDDGTDSPGKDSNSDSSNDNDNDNSGSDTDSGTDSSDSNSKSGNNTSNSNSNGNSSDKNSSSGNNSSTNNPDDAVESIDGKPSTKPTSDGHMYDKGGNLIK